MPGNGLGKTVPALPSFFIIGPPRTGTSWLHNILSQKAWLSHPTKETRFFDRHFDRGLHWYKSHYRKANGGRTIGEVAPTYFASSEARERIARLIPYRLRPPDPKKIVLGPPLVLGLEIHDAKIPLVDMARRYRSRDCSPAEPR